MSKASITPDLDLVFKKWEHKKHPKGRLPNSSEVTGKLTNRILSEGRQRWREKFGDSVRALRQRRPRERRRIYALPAENITERMIARFKSTPIVTPETLVVQRPFMGQCCGCLPDSKKDFITSSTPKQGIRNILNVQTGFGKMGRLERTFDHMVYSLRRRTVHKYPDSSLALAVLSSSRVAEAVHMQKLAVESNSITKKSEESPEEILQFMRADVSNRLLRLAGWFLLKFLSYFLNSVQVHVGQIEMIKKAVERDCPVIYIPLHRSHLDYILVTFILWNYDIKAPYIASGDNLRMPVFSWLIKGLGGFFIRRKLDKQSGQKDVVYRAVLHSYMEEILKEGESLEFFIEGGRSRSGKACTPKAGLMSVVIDALSNDVMEDAFIVPISINYEQILDGNFNREQMGLPKVKETFSRALKAIWSVFCGNYGSVRVEFCQPFSLKEYIKLNQPPAISSPQSGSDQSDSEVQSPSPIPLTRAGSSSSLFGTDIVVEDQRHMIKQLAEHIVHTSVHSTPIMCTNLLAFLLLTKHRQGTSMRQLICDFDMLREELKSRGRDAAFVGSSNDVVKYACSLLGQNICYRESEDPLDEVVTPVISLPTVFELSYYSNTVVSVFLLESVLVCSVIYHCDIALFVPDQFDSSSVIPASKDDILDTACEICKLLKYEFICIPPCNKLDDIMIDILQQLVSVEVLELQDSQNTNNGVRNSNTQWANRLSATVSWDDEDDLVYQQEQFVKANLDRQDCVDKMVFYHHVLAPFLESYLVTARQIRQELTSELPEEDFVKSIHNCAIKRVETGVAGYSESAAFDSIKNAMKSYQDLKLIDCYYAGKIRMVEMHDHFEVQDKINNYIALLEMLQV